MWNEFKQFAMRGNVLDLAVGVIIGGAFGKIVSSLVEDILTPILGLLSGGINFTDLIIQFGEAKVKYGQFIQSVLDFFIIAFSIFLFIKIINRFKKKEEQKSDELIIDRTEELLTEIRDLLKEQKENSTKNETS
ncbi:large conductance mechanosensitive channel protein MscL [Neobacillus thermocopriae]|uniref:Large-conductance mechanosensitive channel n=1 Tax=Neobacillus thermocopriae TaxID=1215031 RepID=A0A6B3TUQ7_9BACI|nr:large conductance mechanosensitive channel protein MscL [Neobacillus thermocopriae]MED3625217.1 large conductance mechanosensitive channel protein MscL [Neobacillus thermocopriae]MED3715103.1 large conductance mechanosensitive channel protein MscL [Neobacillus thermocopriae]NEX80049.1 large conductance mechanosensitive channel protein MscL [Neobacillus thermocopriae]